MAGSFNRSWQVPTAETDERYRLGWLDEAVEDGSSWNASQPGYSDWRRSLEIINGQESTKENSDFRSYLSGRRVRTNVRTAIAGLANIRPIWGYHAAPQFEKFAMMLNKSTRAQYLEGFWGQDVKDCLSYAAATNTGWIRPVYRRGMAGTGQGKIELLTYGQPCVLPVQMPSSGDYQQAYAVTLMDEIPIFEAHSRWPVFQDLLKPTKSQYWYSSEIRGAAENNSKKSRWQNLNPFARKDQGTSRLSNLLIPIRYTTIIDVTVNTTGQTIPMGQAGTPWYYEVPSYKTVMKDGRMATEDDARLYPFRRLMISSESCIMYDGPAFNWHGQLDLTPMVVDRWPWAPGGFSMVHDAYNIEKNLNRLERGMMDRLVAQNNIGLAYDLNVVNPTEAEAYDPLDPDHNRVGYDGSEADMPFKLPLPMEWYKISPEMLAFCQSLRDGIDYTMQIRDLVELSKAKALGKDMDSIEKLLSSLGPIVKDIGLGMERSLGMVGHQIGWLTFQYLTTSRIMQYSGPDSVVQETFDYNPADLYPSHLPDENAHGEDQAMKPSKYTSAERARWMAGKVRFLNVPGSIHQVAQAGMLLQMLAMKSRNMPISDYSTMAAAGIPDIVPPDGNSEQQRWEAEQEDKVRFQARMAVITQTIAGEQGLGGGAPVPGSGKKAAGGRPPTAGAAPHMETKDGGTRPVVSESK